MTGNLYTILHNDEEYELTHDTVPAGDVDVYIQFGEDKHYGDRIKTGKDGSFEFRYLTKGDYTVFSFSELPSGEKVPVEQTIKVSAAHKTFDIGHIYIEDGKAFGTSLVKGTVTARYFNGQGQWVSGELPAGGERVFIKAKSGAAYFDDVRVGADGSFVFRRITPGTYEIFTYSFDTDDEVPYVVKTEITVTETGKVITLPAPLKIFLKA